MANKTPPAFIAAAVPLKSEDYCSVATRSFSNIVKSKKKQNIKTPKYDNLTHLLLV